MTTEYFLIGVGLVLLGLELWALRRPDDDVRLITTVIRAWSRTTSFLPFAAGVLAGHFFWCGG